MNVNEKIIRDKKGTAVAVQIPVIKYKKILGKLEELDDIRAFDKAVKRKQQFVPFDEAVKRLKVKREK